MSDTDFHPPPRTALVTGAGKRIGRAVALDLARHGWGVALHYRSSADAADAVVAEIAAGGGRAVALRADLRNEAETSGLVPAAAAALGPVGLLVNSAAVFFMDTVADSTRESWDDHIETNLRAPLVLVQAFAAALPDDTAGNVVNIIDQRVWNLTPYFLSYTVSKAGLWTLTQTLALALAPRIRVNAIGPGPTLRSPRQTEEQFAQHWGSLPLRRPTDPGEIAEAVRFIVSAPALTGQMLALDAGEHLAWAQPKRGFVPDE
jgi:NAD(P)-dependent dehydrogenase (short-subunit alcohol dehydrogenase family)